MTPEQSQARLSRISTLWTLIHQAHGDSPNAGAEAHRLLMQRYCGAVYRYLLGALRDEEAALELFQEFALRFVRGDFRRADPERGRFRDYVRTSLIHLVTDYHRARANRPGPLPADLAAPPMPPMSESDSADADESFLQAWRNELIDRAWVALAEQNSTYHSVLLEHVEHPDAQPAERLERLGRELNRELSPSNLRVTLHRARQAFARHLRTEVERSLDAPSELELAQELQLLRLEMLCRAE